MLKNINHSTSYNNRKRPQTTQTFINKGTGWINYSTFTQWKTEAVTKKQWRDYTATVWIPGFIKWKKQGIEWYV